MTGPLVSTDWLAQHLRDPDLVVLDATWTWPGTAPDAAALYAERHIPGAHRFDIEQISDHTTPLPHMAPPAELFASEARRLGIGDDTLVVAYDAAGMATAAARAWWMFRLYGHDRVAVLDGGLPKWLAEGRPTERGAEPPPAEPKRFPARFRPALLRDIDGVKAIAERGSAHLFDARSRERFEGTAAEPWAGGRGGHIPKSRSVPAADLVDARTGTLLPKAALERRFAEAGIGDGPVVASCGSGVTACVIALALATLGRDDVAVYDGSWAEWGSHPELSAETGPAKD